MKIRALLICLALAGCSPGGGTGPFTESRLPPNLAPQFWAPPGWTWGLVEVKGAPAMRYGVAAPRGASRGNLIILTGYGETAEGWFETAADLVARDFTVWVLEPTGQGGSGRYGAPRDSGQAPDMNADADGLRALAGAVVRPDGRLIVVASGTSGPAAVLAAANGLAADRIILSGAADPSALRDMDRRWTRPADDAGETPRGAAQIAWMEANPDLRMAAPTRGWLRAYDKAETDAGVAALRGRIDGVVMIVGPDAGPADCQGFSACDTLAIPADGPYQAADDAVRAPWLAVLAGE